MNLKDAAIAAGSTLTLAALTVGLMSLPQGQQATPFDSGPQHMQYIVCAGPTCLQQLVNVQQQLNVLHGFGKFVDGGYVSTPYYAEGSTSGPTTDEAIPIQNPVLPGIYKFEVPDGEYTNIIAILDGGILPSPVAVLDPTWSSAPNPDIDGGVILPDGGTTTVAVLQDASAVVVITQDSGSVIQDSGSVILDSGKKEGGSVVL